LSVKEKWAVSSDSESRKRETLDEEAGHLNGAGGDSDPSENDPEAIRCICGEGW
jgi:hypothetical protein